MKKVIGILVMFFLYVALNAQVQNQPQSTVNLRIGDSESKGLAGIEFQFSNLSISGGWRPERLPAPADRAIHSFEAAFTIYGGQFYQSSFYLTLAMASKGVVYVDRMNEITGENHYAVEPTINFLVGHRFNFKDLSSNFSNRFNLDAGIGGNFGSHACIFAFEFIINYSLCRRHFN